MKIYKPETERRRLDATMLAIVSGANTARLLANLWSISEAHACQHLVEAFRSGRATRVLRTSGRSRAYAYAAAEAVSA